jgi:flavin reductase (DIM6/NTAB) family NADH-FMN oxidoreductase RutF
MAKLSLPKRPIGPFPTMLAGAFVNGRPNYITIGACGVVCLDPILYISLKSDHYTTQGVKESGFFSVNIPSTKLTKETDYCGINSGRSVDKSALFTTWYDDSKAAPMIQECPVNFICKVIHTLPINGFDLFLGEITAVYADDTCLTAGKIDPVKIDPIILLGMNYMGIGNPLGSAFQIGRTLVNSSLK